METNTNPVETITRNGQTYSVSIETIRHTAHMGAMHYAVVRIDGRFVHRTSGWPNADMEIRAAREWIDANG